MCSAAKSEQSMDPSSLQSLRNFDMYPRTVSSAHCRLVRHCWKFSRLDKSDLMPGLPASVQYSQSTWKGPQINLPAPSLVQPDPALHLLLACFWRKNVFIAISQSKLMNVCQLNGNTSAHLVKYYRKQRKSTNIMILVALINLELLALFGSNWIIIKCCNQLHSIKRTFAQTAAL